MSMLRSTRVVLQHPKRLGKVAASSQVFDGFKTVHSAGPLAQALLMGKAMIPFRHPPVKGKLQWLEFFVQAGSVRVTTELR